MPFRDPYGRVAGLVGRTILSEKEQQEKKVSKYKNTKFEKGSLLFGLYENKQHILNRNFVYIVEGQIDVIKASEIGLRNIVALGNSSLTSYQFSVISRYSNNLFLLLDNDEAGQKGRKQIISKFGHMANIRNFYIPDDYKDIDEYITKGGVSDQEDLSLVVKD
jgi:DNA primase